MFSKRETGKVIMNQALTSSSKKRKTEKHFWKVWKERLISWINNFSSGVMLVVTALSFLFLFLILFSFRVYLLFIFTFSHH